MLYFRDEALLVICSCFFFNFNKNGMCPTGPFRYSLLLLFSKLRSIGLFLHSLLLLVSLDSADLFTCGEWGLLFLLRW
jgi:hypothetical protein